MKKIASAILSLTVAGGCFTGFNGALAQDGTSELVTNGGFESGTTDPWLSFCGSEIEVSNEEYHGGERSMKITGREAANSGAIIDLSGGGITPGATYKISAWVKYNEGPDILSYNIIMIGNDSSANASYKPVATAAAQKGEWTLIETSYTVPDNLDTTSLAQFYFETQTEDDNIYYDFYVDDVSIELESVSDAKPALAKTPGRANPLMGYDFGADPFAMEYNGRLYVYMTADAFTEEADGEPGANSYGQIHTIKVISSEDLINWTDHGEIPVGGRVLENGAAKWATNSWAPSVVHKTINGEEKFFLYFADNGSGIGVLVSDSPTGPFTDPIGGPIVNGDTPGAQGVVWMFDPAVYIDDDGSAYMYFGGGIPAQSDGTSLPEDILHPRSSRVIKLGDDMISTEGEAVMIDAPGIFEDSGMHKYGDTYYYSYCTNFDVQNYEDTDGTKYPSGTICYMTSDSPMGPFTYRGSVLDNMYGFFGMGGNNHHAIFEFKDSYYMIYHARTLEKAMGYDNKDCRSTHINKVEFNEDGTMQPVIADYIGDPIEGVTIDAGNRLEAETIAYGTDISVERMDEAGNSKVTGITNGSWTSVANVDFCSGELAYISARVFGKTGGTVEVRYDSVNGETAGTINIAPSDDWQTVNAVITPASGVHDLYFVFKGEDGSELFDVDCWQFSENAPIDQPSEDPGETGHKVLFEDDFSTDDNAALYAEYTKDTLDSENSGIMYEKLVHKFVNDWGDSHGMRMDITSIVTENDVTSVGASALMGSYYWGTSDELVTARMVIEVTDAEGNVKNTYSLDEKPDSYDELDFADGRAEVQLSGETNISYQDGDSIYLCIINGTGYQDYDNISIWTNEGGPTDQPGETEQPGQDTRVIIFNDDFSSQDDIDRYEPYAEGTLSESADAPSGIDYGALVYNFADGWGDDHGMRMDITDIVKDNSLDSFGVNAKFGSYYWGTSDADLAKVSMSIEIAASDGTVKDTTELCSMPDSYADLTFNNNRAEVYLMGELGENELSYDDGDTIYLCIKHGSGRHDYDDITTWTRGGAEEPDKTVKVYTPYLDGSEAVVTVTNTMDTSAELRVYAAEYDGESLKGITSASASVEPGAVNREIRVAAKAGDAIYVWNEEQQPYREETVLEEQSMITSWTTAQMEFRDEINPSTPLTGSTIRQVVKLSETGDNMQLTLSNEYGKEPLVIDALHFAKPLDGSMIDIATDTAVTFNGSESVTIPAGETIVSDPVMFDAGEDGKIAVTMHIAGAPQMITGHEVSLTTTYIRNGGTVSDISMIGSETNEEWFFISSIDVMQDADNGVIVCLGDSITDGVGASSAANTWPALLNERLNADPETAGLSVVNQGIGGNKVNGYSWGDRARWRYERDVLGQKGVKYLIILEGINDIGGRSEDINGEYDGASTDGTLTGGIIDAYQEIIDAAHEQGIKVIGATILPCGKSGYYEQGGEGMEAMRQKLNAWIRTEGNFDAVIDFDAITADPENLLYLLDEYDCGDGLHPGDAGYKAMADSIDLGLFK